MSVTGQSGRDALVIDKVREAWLFIQNIYPEWIFLRDDLPDTCNLSPGAACYTAASFSIENFADWTFGPIGLYIHDPVNDPTREAEEGLYDIGYVEWWERYQVRTHNHNRPTEFAVDEDRRLCFGPTPDADYRVRGKYVRSPQMLMANEELPIIDAQFHDAIKWRALLLMNEFDEESGVGLAIGGSKQPHLHGRATEPLPPWRRRQHGTGTAWLWRRFLRQPLSHLRATATA